MAELVSAIVTTCKREPEMVLRAVRSILSQTYKDIEIIVVDDSPADYPFRAEIRDSLLELDPLINVIWHKENQGACVARNTGLNVASGEFVAYLDDDDEWLPEKITLQMEKFVSDDIGLVYCGRYLDIGDGTSPTIENNSFFDGCVFKETLKRNFIGSTSFPLIRKSALDDIGGFDPLMQSAQDYDVWVRIAQKYSVDYVSIPLVVYHIHDDRISANPKKKIEGLERINEKYGMYFDSTIKWFRNRKLAPYYASNKQIIKALKLWLVMVSLKPNRVKDNLSTLKRLISNYPYFQPFFIVRKLSSVGILNWMPDKLYLMLVYKARFGYSLNLGNPISYNEKIQWLKLYDKNPKYVQLVDKYLVREFVSEVIGSEFLVPLLGVWDNAEDIDFSSLPSQYVLKCNHDSGSVIVCTNREKFDERAAIKSLNTSLRRGTYYYGREWPYKFVKPKILAEKYLEDNKYGELRDYKFFCFDGKVKALYIATDRMKKSATRFDFYDMDFNHLNIINGHPMADIPPEKPINFDLMVSLAEKLSVGIPHVRVDFYEVNGTVYFSEMTLYHHSGLTPFKPSMWDKTFGEWIKLLK